MKRTWKRYSLLLPVLNGGSILLISLFLFENFQMKSFNASLCPLSFPAQFDHDKRLYCFSLQNFSWCLDTNTGPNRLPFLCQLFLRKGRPKPRDFVRVFLGETALQGE